MTAFFNGDLSSITFLFPINFKNSGSTTKKPPLIQPLCNWGFSSKSLTISLTIDNSSNLAGGWTAEKVIIFFLFMWKFNNCFKFISEQVDCPNDISKINKIPIINK